MGKFYSILLFVLSFTSTSFAVERNEDISRLHSGRTTVGSLYRNLSLERVVDGDTFYASGINIRLWGIDAPEKNEKLFEKSKKALELFLENAQLNCKFIDFDKYKRQVMHCYVDQADLGGLMIKTGFAKDFVKYSGGFYRQEEMFAKEANLGIWKNN